MSPANPLREINRFERDARSYWMKLRPKAPAEIDRLVDTLDELTQIMRDLERVGIRVRVPHMGPDLGDSHGAD